MTKIKLRVLNQFGASLFLGSVDDIEVHFPYESSESLIKRMSYGGVSIIDAKRGEFEVTLNEFELEGLLEGENQNFVAKIKNGAKIKEATFARCLNVRRIDGKKAVFKNETRI